MIKKPKKCKTLSFKITEELYNRISSQAIAENRSISNLAITIIQNYLKLNER